MNPEKKSIFKLPFFGKEPELEVLDELDQKILSLISINARISVLEIGKLLKKPPTTIRTRIKLLEKREIIQGYTTYIRAQNYEMQSYRLFLYLENMDEHSRKKLFSYASENSQIILAIETLGPWNFEITLEVENQEKLQREIVELRNQFNNVIKNIEFIIMFEDDLVYDPYPLLKRERLSIKNSK